VGPTYDPEITISLSQPRHLGVGGHPCADRAAARAPAQGALVVLDHPRCEPGRATALSAALARLLLCYLPPLGMPLPQGPDPQNPRARAS
jgi:hypothetical protein